MNLFKTSIGKKILMALSALFLIVFLIQHFLINITSTFDKELFNFLSHFMGTNFLVQFLFQPILITGVIFHFVMGFILEYKNQNSTQYKNIKSMHKKNSLWISRNMIISGLAILSFIILHFIDFWIPEINYKYINNYLPDPDRYYVELSHKFDNLARVIVYCISFVFLSLHLLHGFRSSIKSLGFSIHSTRFITVVTVSYSILIPLGFCFIAVFHYLY